MFMNRFFSAHRTWEDWFVMLLGLAIALSPWASDDDHVSRIAVWNAVLIGVLVFFATLHLVRGLGRMQGQLAKHLLVAGAAR